MFCVLCQFDQWLHKFLLQNKFNTVFMGAYMANSPQSSSLLQHGAIFRQDIGFKSFEMVAFPQEIGTNLCLYEFTVEMSWIFDCFMLLGQDLDPVNDRIQEELWQNVAIIVKCRTLEHKVDSILHHNKLALSRITGEPVSHLFVDLWQSPRRSLILFAFWVNISSTEFWRYWNVPISQLF